jgi:hypothetical protein
VDKAVNETYKADEMISACAKEILADQNKVLRPF